MPGSDLITLTIDGTSVTVPKGTLVIEAAGKLGIKIPTFCSHPTLRPHGSCRMCMVEIEKMPKLATSCTTIATEGMVVHTQNSSVDKAREGVLEFLLANHPLDCPICDKGGECDLQDHEMRHGPAASRYEEKKRWRPYGKFSSRIAMDYNRCVLCARCVRFTQEIAGDDFLDIAVRGDESEIIVASGHTFESKFSGNVIDYCPVGSLTSLPFRFTGRVWELDKAISICNYCSVGCNLNVESRFNELRRIQPANNPQVEDWWICDKGRFGFDIVDSERRTERPLLRKDESDSSGFAEIFQEVTWGAASQLLADRLKSLSETPGPAQVGVIVGTKLTNEDLILLSRFFREVIGTDNIDWRMTIPQGDPVDLFETNRWLRYTSGTIDSILNSKAVLLFNSDTVQEQPILGLRLRQSYPRPGPRIISLNRFRTEMDPFASAAMIYKPGSEPYLLAGMIKLVIEENLVHDESVESLTGTLEGLKTSLSVFDWAIFEAETDIRRSDLKDALKTLTESPTKAILIGQETFYDPRFNEITRGLLNFGFLIGAMGHESGGITLLTPDGNTNGAIECGVEPTRLAGWRRNGQSGMNTKEILEGCTDGRIRLLYVIGKDVLRSYPDRALVGKAIESVEFLVVQDMYLTETAKYAHLFLPAVGLLEKEGTLLNLEQRLQKSSRAIQPNRFGKQDAEIIRDLCFALGHSDFCDLSSLGGWSTKAIYEEFRIASPLYRKHSWEEFPEAGFVPSRSEVREVLGLPERYEFLPISALDSQSSTRTFCLITHPTFFGRDSQLLLSKAMGSLGDPDSIRISVRDAESLLLRNGDPVELRGRGNQHILGPVKIDPNLPDGILHLPRNSSLSVNSLSPSPDGVIRVSLTRLES